MDEKISTSVPSIDTLLEGGIEKGIVTEVYGVAGSGKTNFMLQLAAQVLKKGERIVIIDTEGLSYTRMRQIFGENYQEYLRQIRINRPLSFEEQLKSVGNLKKLKDYSFVAVDSINMYMRMEYSTNESGTKEAFVRMLIALQTLSRERNIPVLITSQVYSSGEEEVLPFSGKSMEHIVKCILLLKKTGRIGERELVIKKHRSIQSEKKCKFLITEKGLQ
ncbi:MAG TPA: DNA repair and recombination protein RadB [Thermoplasmata archaeon]|nr:DNA repair and recombination protein RadB [Thermoplasmata archaeon]